MAQHNRFILRNDLSRPLTLNIEPEGAHFELRKGEEVFVIDDFASLPVTLKLTESETSGPIISIWPGDGVVTVEKDGVNVFDLVQGEVTA